LHAQPRQAMTLILALSLYSCLLIIGPHAAARAQEQQQPAAATATERDRGIGLYKQGNIKDAIKALRAAVKQNKADADAWYFLSLALNRDGDTKGARKAIEKSVQLRPDFAPARAGLAYFLLLSNKIGDALREAEAALALDAHDAEAHYVASVAHLRRDATDKALEEIQAALAAKPDFAAAHLWKSQVLLALYSESTDYAGDESPEARARRAKGTGDLLKRAADSLEKYLMSGASSWRRCGFTRRTRMPPPTSARSTTRNR
jgi:tetratricopeptide (TPR) repeat protein